ncbi:hypothetical protein SEPCBS57363_006331 [Sporothrix epigloea]|uniref:Uncharacterized protein n=1 Tax=Sporothrix epigloea TaxID=1892477 RepID=A0ABP0E2H6_9PEZI
MADRNDINNRHQVASRVSTSAFPGMARVVANSSMDNGGTSISSTTTSVRRNLFQSQLTRRPTQAAPVDMVSATVSRENTERDITAEPNSSLVEIVVRDRNGEVELVDPPSPATDDMGEMAFDTRQESERERQRLADTIKYHQQRTSIPGQPEGTGFCSLLHVQAISSVC